MCSSNKYSRRWEGKHEEQTNRETWRESLFTPEPYLLFLCLSCFREGSRALVPCVYACVLAKCNSSSDHDRGATVQRVPMTRQCMFMLLFPSCLCGRTRRLMLQQCSTISLACQVTSCTSCLGREQKKNMALSLSTVCPHLPCSFSLPLSLFLWPQAFLPLQVYKFYNVPPAILNVWLPADTDGFDFFVNFCFWRTEHRLTVQLKSTVYNAAWWNMRDCKGALYWVPR